MNFSRTILKWYAENKRELPWRSTQDPYKIWLSEIILQQTRIAQGLPYYEKFISAFPSVYILANAKEERVLKLWQGLGYYSRARNMHKTAKHIVDSLNGVFPNTYEGLLKLKGVGDYTASAIASICYDLPEPVVDGNVYRVLARYFGVQIPINSSKGVTYFKELAREVLDEKNSRDYNQGIMEFGAIQCAPKKPFCLHCPLQLSCEAFNSNRIHELPIKLSKTKIKNRYFNYLVPILHQNQQKYTVLNQRTNTGIWQNLYEFPLLELEKEGEESEIKQKAKQVLRTDSIQNFNLFNEKVIVHKLSHQHLYTRFWILEMDRTELKSIPWETINDFPVPILIADFIKAFKI